MNLETLYCELAYGELSNLSMATAVVGEIAEAQKPKIVIAANEALLRLYTRFILKENDVIVEMVEGTTFYHLRKKYAEQSYDPSSGVYPYIRDLSREKFEEDVLKVLTVFDNKGNRRALNDATAYRSLYVPQANVIQNPNPLPGEVLSIGYQAMHPKLVCNSIEPVDYTIELPDVLLGAFRAYIAYKIYTNMNTAESTAKADEHMSIYENICAEVKDTDMVNSSLSNTNIRFNLNGWV